MSSRDTRQTLPERRLRRILRRTALALALTGLAAIPVLMLSGGFETHIYGVEIRAHRPGRALWLVVVGAIAFVALGGRWSLLWRDIRHASQRRLERWESLWLPWLPPPRTLVMAMAATICLLGVIYATRVASGSDSYGYVSQADLWLSGRMAIPQPFAAEVPWPRARDTFAPLGYKAAVRDGVPSLVPTYSPGLPLLFAAFKAVGGHNAMFLVVPLLAGVLVLATYGIGCRLGSPGAGLIGAALVATSPAVLFMLMAPMTDVPVAALWAASFYLLTGGGRSHALGGGLAAAVAVMTRPNLVPLAAIGALYYAPALIGGDSRQRALGQALLFAMGVLPGVVAVGAINHNLYGSPFVSGYGSLLSLFDWDHVTPNFWLYLGWLVETQSVVALVGLAALALPVRWLWPGREVRWTLVIAALFVFSVWAQYLAYLVFEDWWYLRFLLTIWPFMMVGVGAVAMAIWTRGGRLVRAAVVAALGLLVFFQTGVVADRQLFGQWAEERRYVTAAQMVQRLTPPNSVILAMQHSGAIRYYGGRMTLRYDFMDRAWLDRAVAWLADHGVRTYLAIEGWELPEVTRRFEGTSDLVTKLDAPPLAIHEHPGRVLLFDLSGPPQGASDTVTGVDRGLRAAPPASAPTLVFPPSAK